MPSDPIVSQRHLVGLRVRLADAEVVTKYVFPFVDGTWSVPFCVLDVLGGAPRIVSDRLESRADGLSSAARLSDLRPIESVAPEAFRSLVHFDPWWVFRGIGGVPRPWIDAVIATNIAGSFTHDHRTFKVFDLEFTHDLSGLDSVLAKDESFRGTAFDRANIDLLGLTGAARKHAVAR